MSERLLGRPALFFGAIVAIWGSSLGALAAPTSTSSAASTSSIAGFAPPKLSAPKMDRARLAPSATAPIFEKGTPLTWHYAEFDAVDWVTTGVGLSLAISGYAVRGSDSKKQGGVLFDEDVRDAVRLTRVGQRETARDISDVLLTLLTSFPFLVDSLIITYWHRTSPQAALEMALIDVQAIAITAGLQSLVSALTARERPYGRTCGKELSLETRDCEPFNRNTSFFSGHTSLGFTIAGLVCSNHSALEINGDPISDALPCFGALATASTVGLMRMLGDMHYLSDVLTGAAVGALIGFGVPWLFHYRHDSAERPSDFTLQLVPSANGAAIAGTF